MLPSIRFIDEIRLSVYAQGHRMKRAHPKGYSIQLFRVITHIGPIYQLFIAKCSSFSFHSDTEGPTFPGRKGEISCELIRLT